MNNPSDDNVRALLQESRRIAVVGLSPDRTRPSFGVARYLQTAGYEILPVNPKYAGGTILGQAVVSKVTDLVGQIDIVDLFRRAIDTPRPVNEAIASGAKAIWMQLGIKNEAVGEAAAAAGLIVVMDSCIAIEHRRLVGS